MAYAWFEDNHSLRLLPLLSRDGPNGCIEFASHGTNRVFLSVGGHCGKSNEQESHWMIIKVLQGPLVQNVAHPIAIVQQLLDIYRLCFL